MTAQILGHDGRRVPPPRRRAARGPPVARPPAAALPPPRSNPHPPGAARRGTAPGEAPRSIPGDAAARVRPHAQPGPLQPPHLWRSVQQILQDQRDGARPPGGRGGGRTRPQIPSHAPCRSRPAERGGDRGNHVQQRDRLRNHAPAPRAAGKPDDQRHPGHLRQQAVTVIETVMVEQLLAMIGGDDDQVRSRIAECLNSSNSRPAQASAYCTSRA